MRAELVERIGGWALLVALCAVIAWFALRVAAASSVPEQSNLSFGLAALIGLGCLVFLGASAHGSYALIRSKPDRAEAVPLVLIFWTGIAALGISFDGYRLISVGVAAALAGMDGTAAKALEVLLRLEPFHPMQSVLAIPMVAISGLNSVDALDRSLGSPLRLLWIALPSATLFTWILFRKGTPKFLLGCFLLVTVSLLGAALIDPADFLQRGSAPILIRSGLLLCCTFGWMVAYSALRARAPLRAETEGGPPRLPRAPSAWILPALALLIAPGAADIRNHLRLERARAELGRSLERIPDVKMMEVAALALNVRTLPKPDAERVGGVLGFAQRVGVLEEKDGWAKIGEGRWVNATFLRRIGQTPVLSGTVSRELSGTTETVAVEIGPSYNGKLMLARYRASPGGDWLYLVGAAGRQPLTLREEGERGKRLATVTLDGDCLDVLAGGTTGVGGCKLEGQWAMTGHPTAGTIATTEAFHPIP